MKQLDASKQGTIYKLKMTLQRAEGECEGIISEIFRAEKQTQLLEFEQERAGNEKTFMQLKKDIMLEQNQIKARQAELRTKQSNVKENLGQLLDQKRMFSDMVKLLQAKQESIRRMKQEMQQDLNGEHITVVK